MTTSPSASAEFTFTFINQALRVVMRDGEPWFVAVDVCQALDVQNVTQAVARLDDDERAMFNIGRQGSASIINESGLYSLILGSRKPEAKKFKKWVTSEVLPAIRKNGRYEAVPAKSRPQPLGPLDMANLRRLIAMISRDFRYKGAWVQGVWVALRKTVGVPAPYPFEVKHLPAIAEELVRIHRVAQLLRESTAEVEDEVLTKVVRARADIRRMVTTLRGQRETEFKEQGEALQKACDAWIAADVRRLVNREQSRYVDPLDCAELQPPRTEH